MTHVIMFATTINLCLILIHILACLLLVLFFRVEQELARLPLRLLKHILIKAIQTVNLDEKNIVTGS